MVPLGAVNVPAARTNAPVTDNVAVDASTVPVYPELILKLITVGFVSTVQFLVLVALNTTSSAEVGARSLLQLAASDQLLVDPPPSHVRVAA
jgi:hypothetical protein